MHFLGWSHFHSCFWLATFHRVKFVIIGDGQARAAIQQQAPENVVFRGWVPYAELPSQYQQADAAFVLYEFDRHRTVGLSSLKTLEYAASGLPIFSTRAKGQEFIEANGYGYLVAEEEDVTSAFKIFLAKLSEYKANLLRDQERIRYEGSWDRAANETLKALRPLLRSS
ncbi:MAG: glycosyltransferase [Verrucomicrobiota bacterium]